jgi:hypothetical protein
MKTIISFCTILLITFHQLAIGQTNGGTQEDISNIAISVYIPDQVENISDISRNALEQKLNQLVANNGMSGASWSERFILTANISVQSKELTPTAPPLTALTMAVTFIVGDIVEGKKYASATVYCKGSGENETKAYNQAIKSISISNPELSKFIALAKTRIIDYYASRCDFILKEAQSYADQDKFDLAIFTLSKVPQVSKACYEKCLNMVLPIYKKKINLECATILRNAKAKWSSAQTIESADEVAKMISLIPMGSSCDAEVKSFVGDVAKQVKTLQNRDWDFAVKVYNDEVSIQKATIKAIRDIGVAYGNNQPSQTYDINVIRTWW